MTSRIVATTFWSIRNFILTRNPELLPEYMPLFHEPVIKVAEFLDTHYPHPDGSWTKTLMSETPSLLRELYPHGKH